LNSEAKSNLLPFDGTAIYYAEFLPQDDSSRLYKVLLEEIDWRNDEVYLFGKRHITKRKVALYGDQNFTYTYSNSAKKALPWNAPLLEIKQCVETWCGMTFNSCLLNLYHHGEEGIGWHSDDEKPLGRNPVIASVSLGAERKFSFRHKTKQDRVSVILKNGSLLLMRDETQHYWLHSLPKAKTVKAPRINLTFRFFKQ
jgi:alkylated DNA repair dioxygenase AlkB